LAGLAVLVLARSVMAPQPTTRELLVASRDLPSGTVLAEGDLEVAKFALDTVPPGAVAPEVPPIGRVLAAPLGQGEALTHLRLVGDSLLSGYPDLAITPVRVADVETLQLLDIGTRIDLLATDPGTGTVETLASHVQVVAIPHTESLSTAPGSGGLLLVAVSPDAANRIAAATVTAYISWALSP
jgi:Flp pilus assembly protein CpaB